jgi:hypothetical protein
MSLIRPKSASSISGNNSNIIINNNNESALKILESKMKNSQKSYIFNVRKILNIQKHMIMNVFMYFLKIYLVN